MSERNDFPLIDLFIELRNAGLQLGIRDYEALIKAMQAGFGISSKDALLYLCKTIWAKDTTEAELIKIYFQKYLGSRKRFQSISHQVSLLKYENNIPFLRSNSATYIKISSNRKKFIPLIEKRENHSKTIFWAVVRLLNAIVFLVSVLFIKSIDFFDGNETFVIFLCIYTVFSILLMLFTFPIESILKTRLVDTESISVEKPSAHRIYLVEKFSRNLANKITKNFNAFKVKVARSFVILFKMASNVFNHCIEKVESIKENDFILNAALMLSAVLLTSVFLSQFNSFIALLPWLIVAMIISTNILNELFGGSQKIVRRISTEEKPLEESPNSESNRSNHKNETSYQVNQENPKKAFQNSKIFEQRERISHKKINSEIRSSIHSEMSEDIRKKNVLSDTSNQSIAPFHLTQENNSAAHFSPKNHQRKYLLQAYPFPIKKRQIQQIWRALRQTSNSDRKDKFDLKSTIQKVATEGFFLEEVMTYSRKNQMEIIFFVDFGGSMVAFHELSNLLVVSASDSGRFKNTSVYYFHNCPSQYVYSDRYYQNEKSIDKLVRELTSFGNKLAAVIISDAGSARGSLNEDRIYETEVFLESLKRKITKIVWLNPLPEERWIDTSAEILSKMVPMFDITPRGLSNAVLALRGRTSIDGNLARIYKKYSLY